MEAREPPDLNRPIADFSEDELREYAREHVLYEITHFVRAAQAVESARSENFPMNFALEVFALHVRNLLDFFCPRPGARDTDVLASHFCPDWQEPKPGLYLDEARYMTDKQIMHLTTGRTDDPDLKLIAVEPITYALLPIIERFVEQATLVCDEFTGQAREILLEIPPKKDWRNLPPQKPTATSMLPRYD